VILGAIRIDPRNCGFSPSLAGSESDGDEKESAGRGTSLHADEHGQSGVDVPESRPMEGSGAAGSKSNGDEKEGAGGGTPRHVDERGQSGYN
jgi:hypothetical protein